MMKIPHLSYVLTFICVSIVGAQDLATFDFSTASFGATTTDSGLSNITLTPTGSQGESATITDPTTNGSIDDGTYLFDSSYLFISRQDWVNWGNANSNQTGPFTLSVTADSGYDLSISGLTIDTQSQVGSFSVATIYPGFHEDGGTASASAGAAPSQTAVMTFDTPVEVSAGETQVFNIRLNSSSGGSQHIFSGMSLQGSSMAIPEPSSYALLSACFVLVAVMLRRRYYI